MFYTIGFNDIPCVKSIGQNSDLTRLDTHNTYIFIHARGAARERWKRLSPFSPIFELDGVLPTVIQRDQLQQYSQKGGTIISSLVNPDVPITTTAFCEEISLEKRKDLSISGDGCTIEFEYSPYNWLTPELAHLPYEAYKAAISKDMKAGRSMIVEQKAETVIFNVGTSGGKIIFTALLNNANTFRHIQELGNIYETALKRGKSYAASR